MDAQTFKDSLLRHLDFDSEWYDYEAWELVSARLATKGNSFAIPPVEPKTAVVTIIDQNQHEEGNWHTDLYIVFQVVCDGSIQYFKKTGYFQSHDGEYWDGELVEVFPQVKTITTWIDATAVHDYDDDESF